MFKKDKVKEIPKEIKEIISYLAYSFSISMNSPVQSKEDLQQDLVVYYLENYKRRITKNEWFIRFKNHLLDKYRRVIIERKINQIIQRDTETNP